MDSLKKNGPFCDSPLETVSVIEPFITSKSTHFNNLGELTDGFAIIPGNGITYTLSLLALNLSITTNQPISNVKIQLHILGLVDKECFVTATNILYNSSSGSSDISVGEFSTSIYSGEAFYISIVVDTPKPPNVCSIIVSSYSVEIINYFH